MTENNPADNSMITKGSAEYVAGMYWGAYNAYVILENLPLRAHKPALKDLVETIVRVRPDAVAWMNEHPL
jgi:hypothetical protein